MPTYEFKCCDNHQIHVSGIVEKIRIPQCNTCRKDMKRVYDFQNVQFKGSGFYTNDRKEK